MRLWRYWLSIALALLVVVSVGTYYMEAAGSKPDFVLAKRSGDEKEAAGVRLSGQFDGDVLTIGTTGSEYRNGRSLAFQLNPAKGNDDLGRLIAEHRNFMRGKRNVYELYEDNGMLVYAHAKDEGKTPALHSFHFLVSRLDKATNQSVSFEVSLPNGDAYQIVRVVDVQVRGEQLKIATQNILANDANSEYHLYSLGLKDGSGLSDLKLMEVSSDVLYRGPYGTDSLGPRRYEVYMIGQLRTSVDGRKDYSAEETGKRLVLFDMQTGKQMKVDSPEIADLLNVTAGPNPDVSISLQGEKLYVARKIESGAKVLEYDIAAAKTSVHEVQAGEVRFVALGGDRLYMLTGPRATGKEQPSLVIADAATGKQLYEGAVTVEGQEQEQERAAALNKLTIYGILEQ